MPVTKDQTKAALNTVMAIADCIQALGSVPDGHLYTRLMDKMSFESYQGFINLLISANLVEKKPSHLLVWIGPKKEGE